MKTEEYVKYLSKEIAKYMELPVEERARLRQIKKEEKELPMKKYFGVFPMAVTLWIKSFKIKS